MMFLSMPEDRNRRAPMISTVITARITPYSAIVTTQARTEPVATTEPQGTTDTVAIPLDQPERLPRCTTPQLALAVKIVDGSAMLVLRRVAGEPCHHSESHIGLTVLDQSGHKVGAVRPRFGARKFNRPGRFHTWIRAAYADPVHGILRSSRVVSRGCNSGPVRGSSHRLRDRNRL